MKKITAWILALLMIIPLAAMFLFIFGPFLVIAGPMILFAWAISIIISD